MRIDPHAELMRSIDKKGPVKLAGTYNPRLADSE